MNLGGSVADRMGPFDEKDWYDVDNISDTKIMFRIPNAESISGR